MEGGGAGAFLLCFPLIAVVAYGVLRDLGAARLAAPVAAGLFAFLPDHLARAKQSRLFLTAYYAIPLAVRLVVAVAEGRACRTASRRPGRRTPLVVAICVLVGAASSPYTAFALQRGRGRDLPAGVSLLAVLRRG